MSIKTLMTASAAVALIAGATAADARTQIRIVGSSTVYPFTTAVAEQFKRKFPQFQAPVVESTGTGGGMKLFCAGIGEQHPDIENASRRIKASEVTLCKANGVTQIAEIQVGLDGIAFAHSRKSAEYNLTPTEIYKALAATPFGKPNTYKTWKDINPKLPATKIEVFGPPPTSGTRDALTELLLTAGCKTNAGVAAMEKTNSDKFKAICTKIREDGGYVEAGENDNLIVQKLAANPNAVGIFGYSYLEENADKIVGLTINGVEPTYDNISSFKYAASRPLYIYVKLQHVRAIRGMKEFLAEYAKESTWGKGGYLAQRGLVAAPDAVRSKSAAIATNLTPLDLASIK